MGTVYLVRHGQASLGAADYDQLSALGERQCEHLGEYFAQRGLEFDAVYTGSLKRHAQSLAAVARGMQRELPAQVCAELDEYHPEALVRAIHAGELSHPGSPEGRRQHFRLLREGLAAWIEARSEPQGLPSYAEFAAGVQAVLRAAQAEHHAGQVLIVSSGGPISAAVGGLLGAAPAAIVELNMRIRNSAVTELAVSERSLAVLSFNHLPHLNQPERQALHSYA